MPRPLRWIPPDELVEITCSTVQGRALLRPGEEANRRILGVLGRAQRRTGLVLHAVIVLSTHYHLLASPRDARQLALFMGFVQTNIAKELNRLHGWRGPFWARRYRSIPVASEDRAQIARLRYVLSNSVKEDLVSRCAEWPGVHSVDALVDGESLQGVWLDRTELCRARQRGQAAEQEDFTRTETVELSPLPCWRDLSREEARGRVRSLVESIEEEHAERRRATGRSPRGPASALAVDPLAVVELPAGGGSAPLVHAASRIARVRLVATYQAFAAEFAEAAICLRGGRRQARFPPGAFPPSAPFVEHGASG